MHPNYWLERFREAKARTAEAGARAVDASGPPPTPPAEAASHAPDALAIIHGADGRPWHVAIYRCPRCGGTNWGQRLDKPSTWWCLDCHGPKIAPESVS